jgi:hypothetical protein
VAIFVLALLLCVPDFRTCVFSTGKRASGSLMETCVDFLKVVPEGTDRIFRHNEEKLYISHGDGDKRLSRLLSFPASKAGTDHCTPLDSNHTLISLLSTAGRLGALAIWNSTMCTISTTYFVV